MGALVAEHAVQLRVLAGAARELFKLAAVATAAQCRFDTGRRKLQRCRGVGLMAAQAIGIAHVGAVAVMTFETLLVVAMLRMTLVAVHTGVRGRVFLHLLTRFAMAGQADRFDG